MEEDKRASVDSMGPPEGERVEKDAPEVEAKAEVEETKVEEVKEAEVEAVAEEAAPDVLEAKVEEAESAAEEAVEPAEPKSTADSMEELLKTPGVEQKNPFGKGPKRPKSMIIIMALFGVVVVAGAVVGVLFFMNDNKKDDGGNNNTNGGGQQTTGDQDDEEDELMSLRDDQRESDIGRLQTALNSYQANNRGKIPEGVGMVHGSETTGGVTGVDGWSNFYERYLMVSAAGAVDIFGDPDGTPYSLNIKDCDADGEAGAACANQAAETWEEQAKNHDIQIILKALCSGETAVSSTGNAKVAMLYKLEGNGIICVNN